MKVNKLVNSIDWTKTNYVLVSKDGDSVLIDPTTQLPWVTTSKNVAKVMIQNVRDTYGTVCIATDFITALRHFAKREGVNLKPPYTQSNVVAQLKLSQLNKSKLN